MEVSNAPIYSVSELIERINSMFKGTASPPSLELDQKTGKLTAVSGSYESYNSGVHILLSKELAHMLGFTERYMIVNVPEERFDEQDKALGARNAMCKNSQVTLCSDLNLAAVQLATNHYSMQMAVPRVFVESSLVKHVSHSTRQLLRAIPVDPLHRYGDIAVKTYDRPIFVPLLHRSFDRIDLKITDTSGKELQFLTGNVVATLEFRRRQNVFF